MRSKRSFILLIVSICMIIISLGVGAAKKDDVVTMAIFSPWDKLNPYDITGNYGDVVFDQIYDRLVYNTFSGESKPRLAKSWQMADDHLSMTFKLNESATWHDGYPLTADDIVFTGRLVTNQQFSSNRRIYFSVFEGTDETGVAEKPENLGIISLNKYTVRFNFKNKMDPYSFLNMFGHFFFVLPEHLLGKMPVSKVNNCDYWQHPIGSGPFKYKKEIPSKQIELTANKDYFLGTPSFNTLVIMVIAQSNIAAGLINGEIDLVAGGGIGDVPLEDWEMVKQQENIVAVSMPTYSYQYFTINCSKPYLQDSRIRQAINLAINKELIVNNLLKGEGLIGTGPLPETHSYFNKQLLPIIYDPEQAKELIDEVGWDQKDQLILMVPIGNVIRERSAPLIQQDLKRIGINVRIQQLDFPTLIKRLREGDFDFSLLGGAGSPDPDDSSVLVLLDSLLNFAHINDQELADLALQGRAGMNMEDRKPVYDKYQMRLKETMPYVWLYHKNSLIAYNKRLKNLKPENFLLLNWNAWEWKI